MDLKLKIEGIFGRSLRGAWTGIKAEYDETSNFLIVDVYNLKLIKKNSVEKKKNRFFHKTI